MKSKTSFFNKTIFLKNITHFWPIWLMILVWNLFIMPFMIFNSSLQYKMLNNITEQEISILRSNDILGIVAVYANPVILFVFSVIAVMAVFSYLYNSRSAYTIHALPVTRKELFITNYVSGLLFLIIPEIVGFLMGTLVSAVCGYTSMNHLLTGMLCAGGLSIIFYSFTVFISMFTGQLMAVPIFTVILHFLFVGCRSLVALLMSMISYGMPVDLTESKMDVLSPLFYILRHFRLRYDYVDGSEYMVCLGFTGKTIIIGYLLVSLCFAVAAYFIYRIRNMETAGGLISIHWICPLFRWGVAFCGGGLFSILLCSLMGFTSAKSIFIAAIVFAIIFGTVCFFGAQMFLEKGFRVFQKKRLVECSAFLLIFGSLYVAIEMDLFGQEKKIPELSQIETAYLDNYYMMGVSDEALIEKILEIHQQMIDSKKEFESFAEKSQETSYVSVSYKLKTGSSLRRSYYIPITEELLDDSTSVVHKIAELACVPEIFKGELFGTDSEDIEPLNSTMDLYDENGDAENYEFSIEDSKKIYEAVIADIDAGNFKEHILRRYFRNDISESDYYNTINLEFISKENDEKPRTQKGTNYVETSTGSAYIAFDKNCGNIIQTLIEIGAIEREEDLITTKEKNAQDEKLID